MPWKRGLQLASHLANRPSALALGWRISTRRTLSSPLLSAVLLPQKNYKHTAGPRRYDRYKKDEEKEASPYRTFPSLHLYMVKALDKTIEPAPKFNHDGRNLEPTKDYNTTISGRFQCRNTKCATNMWFNDNVCMQIRAFPDNTYDAVVSKQFCRQCKHPGSMRINEDMYIAKVADRLKKWAGVIPETPEDDDNKIDDNESNDNESNVNKIDDNKIDDNKSNVDKSNDNKEERGPPDEASLRKGFKEGAKMKSNWKPYNKKQDSKYY